MRASNIGEPSTYDSGYDADELLAQYETYIVALARKKVPRNVIPADGLRDEIDELAQKIRIKIWQIAHKKQITSPRAYIGCIAHTEAVDIVRRYRSTVALSLHEDGEISLSEETQDPIDTLEQEEMTMESTTRMVEEILRLPPRQLHAMLCSLRDRIEDSLPLIEALRDRGVDVEEMSWPDEREEAQRLRASLSIARKKLRSLNDKFDRE